MTSDVGEGTEAAKAPPGGASAIPPAPPAEAPAPRGGPPALPDDAPLLPDVLVGELLAALPDLARDIIYGDYDIRETVIRSGLDTEEIIERLAERADEALRATNQEIADIREAARTLAAAEAGYAGPADAQPPAPPVPGPLPDLGPGAPPLVAPSAPGPPAAPEPDAVQRPSVAPARHAAGSRPRSPDALRRPGEHGLAVAAGITGLWLMAAWPVAVWQAWPQLSTAVGGPRAVLLTIAGALVALALGAGLSGAAVAVARRNEGRPSTRGDWAAAGSLGLGVDVGLGYLLLHFRLEGLTRHALGGGWADLIWDAGGLLAILLAGGGMLWGLAADEKRNGIIERSCGYLAAGSLAGLWLAQHVPAVRVRGLIAGHVPAVAGAAAALAVSLVLLAGPRWVTLRLRHRRQQDLLGAAAAARDRWAEAATEVLRLQLRELIQVMSVPPFSTTRGTISLRGLQHMRSARDVIETQAFDRLRALVSTLGGGAAGVAGPRGAGKSTLLEYYGSGRLSAAGTEHLALMESVPVRYDPREYVLYLYATLCERVIGFRRPLTADPPRPARRAVPWLRHRPGPRAFLGVAWLVLGYLAVISLAGPVGEPPWLHRTWWVPVAVLALGSVTVLLTRTPPAPDDLRLPAGGVRDLADLHEYAERKLTSIRYQQSRTTGWTGSVTLPFGLSGSQSSSLELASQPMTYPEVVSDFRAFLDCVTSVLRRQFDVSPIPVVIILDELDKIASADRAQEFLNEVKALFTLDNPGCLFLVSVSEDVLAQFERRGLPVRDAFDSTFDAVLRVDYLDLADAVRMVRSRVVRLPAPFVCLSHVLSGGLPRELVRYTREIVAEPQDELAGICAAIVGRELKRKAGALETIVARDITAEPHASSLVSFVGKHAEPVAPVLLGALAAPPVDPASAVRPGDPVADLLRLQAEALTHMYYCATLLEVFGSLTEPDLAAARHQAGEGSFDALAAARRQFSVNTRLAWLTISSFRAQWDLPALPPPGG